MPFLGSIHKEAWFLHQDNIGAFLEATGLTLDSVSESLAQGVRLSQPLRCDRSALPDRAATAASAERAFQRSCASVRKVSPARIAQKVMHSSINAQCAAYH